MQRHGRMLNRAILAALGDAAFTEDETLLPNEAEPINVRFADPASTECLIALRWKFVEAHIFAGDLSGVGVVMSRGSMPTPRMAEWILVACRNRRPRYLGGLTVFDIATYLLLLGSTGQFDSELVRWCGIDDSWLSICRGERRDGRQTFDGVLIPMSDRTR